MPIVVFYIVLSFMAVLFFIIFPYFIPLSNWQRVLVLFLVMLTSLSGGYWLAEFTSRWKNKIRDRHEKRFYWYRKMGLFESACLVEPKLAKHHWLAVGVRK